MTTKEKLTDISMLLGTAAAIIIALFASFAKECDDLKNSTFRLHILANSDSAEDQAVKYALRDYILDDLGAIFTACGSKSETMALADRNIGYIEQRANEFLASRGCDYTAQCSVGTASFPTRVYSDVTLPAGDYDALRIVLGEGSGKNWWCVLYPGVCIQAASTEKSVLPQRTHYLRQKAADHRTAESRLAEHGNVEFRFALYDWIKALFGL